jgi:hypothetical protein
MGVGAIQQHSTETFSKETKKMEIRNSKPIRDREEEGTVINVRDVSGEIQEGVTITVVGTYSQTYRKAVNANRDKVLKERRSALDGDAIDSRTLETAAKCIKGWTGFTADGQPFPYNKENAIALLTEAPWIREQVEEAMNDHASFFPKASAP